MGHISKHDTEAKYKKFQDILWDDMHEMEQYDKIKYQMNRIRNLMLDKLSSFRKKSVASQFMYCLTIDLMVMAGKRGTLNDVQIFSRRFKDEMIQKYDPEYGYVEPQYIDVTDKNGKTLQIEII